MLAEKASALPSELTSKATEDLAGIAIKRFRSLGQAIYSRLRQSRAHSKAYEEFEAHWDAAASIREREQAIRELLTKDPQFANSLEKLLFRRDFVEAMAIYCERLPALDHGLHLSEVYVPLFISAAAQSDDSPKEKTDPAKLVQEGNHLIEGGPGTGKSTLLHHLALLESRRLLDDKDGVAFDQLRLPVLISAKELLASTDLASTLQRTLTTTLSTLLPGPLPDNFFRPDVEDGHRYWLIMIDGVDEVEDTRQRRILWDTVSRHTERSDAFKFVVTSRPEAVKPTVANTHFLRWIIDPVIAQIAIY